MVEVDTKQRILDCSLALFSEKGFRGVSIREIAKAVGIKESSIYNHYAGKQAIIEEICSRFSQSLAFAHPPLARVEEMLAGMRPREVFRAFILSYGGSIDPQMGQMAKIVFSEQFHQETVRRIFLEQFVENSAAYYDQVLSLMMQKGRIRPCDTGLVAHLFNNEQLSLSMQFAQCQTKEERKRIAGRMLESADFLIGALETDWTEQGES